MCYAPSRCSIAQASTHLDRPFHGAEMRCKMVDMESCKSNLTYPLAARVACCRFRWVSGASAGLRGLVFYSASADGRVFHWTLGKSTMTCQVSAYSSAWHSLDGRMLHAASDQAQHWLTQSSPECICSKSSSRTALKGKLGIESVQYLVCLAPSEHCHIAALCRISMSCKIHRRWAKQSSRQHGTLCPS